MTMWRWPSFTRKEMECRCCGCFVLSDDFMDALQALRYECAFPFRITSASRCAKHNMEVSTTGADGPHTKGAVDIQVSGAAAFKVVALAPKHGFTGVGVSQRGAHEKRFIHLDKLPDAPGQPRPTCWSY